MRRSIEEVVKGLYLLRVDDEETKYFEAVWSIPEGVTYNAYLLLSSDAVVLFDSWKQVYAEEFVEALRELVDIGDIDYIVLHHMEQDHSGAVSKLLELNGGKAEVWAHPLTGRMLRSFYKISPKFKPLKDGETVKLNGRRIRFIRTPWLHWPETIMSFLLDDGVLLSGDAFGGFSIPSTLFDDDEEAVSRYLRFVRKYVATVVGRYTGYVLKAVDKLTAQGVKLKTVAPAHGLVFKDKPELIVDYYVRLAKGVPEKGKVTVVYDSMYGFVEKAVSEAVEEFKRRGVKPVVYGFTDVSRPDVGRILGDIIDSEALVLGISTYEADMFPYMRYLLQLMVEKIRVGKPVLVISSHGWAATAGVKASKTLTEAGFKVVNRIAFTGQPGGEDLAKVREGVALLLKSI